MPSSVRELVLRLTTETKGMNEGIGAVNSKMSKFGGAMMAAGGAMAAAFSVEKVVDFGKAAIDEASAIEESVSKIGQVFGASAKEAEKFARGANKTMGLSDKAATDYVGTLGNMFTGFGKNQSESLGLSKATMQLAADLGSFNNLGTNEVIDMMSSAFRGEYDSIQRIMPGISGMAVQQEAMAQTGKDNAANLTETEKAMAAMSLMMKQAGPAVGDFARTSEGAANKQKILQANLDDVKANLGAKLLPAYTAVLGFVVDKLLPGLKVFGDWLSGPFVEGIRTAAAFVWKYIEAPFNAIVTIVMGLWQVLSNFVEFIVNVFRGEWGAAWNSVKDMFGGVIKIIMGYVQLFWIYIQTAWNAILAVLKFVGHAIWEAIKYPFEQGWNFVKWVFAVGIEGVKSAWNGIVGWVTDIGRSIKEALIAPFRAAWDVVKTIWNNTFGKISFTIPKWIPGVGGNKFEFPKLAAGGIVTRPTLALIGERGPEAVVPLGRYGGGQERTININVSTGVGDPVEIGRKVAQMLERYEAVNGPRRQRAF